ncbi:TRAP transporter small permease [Bacillus sp. FJAT-50079]|uniref:TRAP transporter small permease n=1 Tax=Bacillus sp. FJAT-50079 TaxID=2833577 RepID=UPI001BC995E8|nr:TRAP transporter small permease [Bacillus sp. FJAT-50079]MBS4208324.1 TRAP transporter small permease [Bacillus sp. FJAT-50079]
MKQEIQDVQQDHVLLRAPALNKTSFLLKITNGLEKITLMLNNILHKISSGLLFFLMLLTTADVIGRNLFNKPITGTYELTGLALAIIIFFSLGTAQIKGDHIEIDFLTNKFPEKLQDGLYAFTSFLLFILVSLTTWQLFEFGKRIWMGHETSGDLGLPLYIFVGATVLGAFVFALTYLLHSLKFILKVVHGHES